MTKEKNNEEVENEEVENDVPQEEPEEKIEVSDKDVEAPAKPKRMTKIEKRAWRRKHQAEKESQVGDDEQD